MLMQIIREKRFRYSQRTYIWGGETVLTRSKRKSGSGVPVAGSTGDGGWGRGDTLGLTRMPCVPNCGLGT